MSAFGQHTFTNNLLSSMDIINLMTNLKKQIPKNTVTNNTNYIDVFKT